MRRCLQVCLAVVFIGIAVVSFIVLIVFVMVAFIIFLFSSSSSSSSCFSSPYFSSFFLIFVFFFLFSSFFFSMDTKLFVTTNYILIYLKREHYFKFPTSLKVNILSSSILSFLENAQWPEPAHTTETTWVVISKNLGIL